ncbi:MAG: bifunctional 5,10-methylenetetrahydrofolate dehydrogenase/5,10-methenyltetrahydrofolate cyclohydrolase, partial [Candidatus Levybacteria bacterium]|nr:bifunctional 5,10-methylenetetrahydrofolate dehydrogenase/5,10-methenyltetrahydrofolate cyclohydrolase [Candidatus Levybacteria bacterium]
SIHHYKEDITADKLLKIVEQLNNDSSVHGIIVQQPLPAHIDTYKIVAATDPKKDVDGFHEKSPFAPPIAAAVLEVLHNIYSSSEGVRRPNREVLDSPAKRDRSNNNDFNTWLKRKTLVIIGKGGTGGKPIREAIENRRASVTVIDSKTEHPASLLKEADIVISCVGRPSPVNFADLKKDAILIGVGMYRGEDGKLHADYDEKTIQDTAAYYTPVPGGIGPVNVAMLLKNAVDAAKEA